MFTWAQLQQSTVKRQRKAAQGFTMVEMMVVLAIIGILASFAVPAFQDMMRNNAVWNVSTEFQRAMSLARTEAVKRNMTVSAVPATLCTNGVASANNWGCGWRVFTDANGDGVMNNGVQMGRATADVPISGATLANGVIGTPNGAMGLITFGPNGNLAPNFGIRTITFCPTDLGANCVCTSQRVATLDSSGRVSVRRPC